ncbi:MAG: glycosyltransferase, partial [Bacteroidia bacterium]|nr:glycosyltransferase [Bacteroidia bacterium]
MGQELISILIPFKNTVLFLPECLDSILKQTYTNWEAILVDDNSDDDSFELVKTYSEIDNRFKPLKNPGNGIIEALRCAYNNSKGEFITRMDSDDIMME